MKRVALMIVGLFIVSQLLSGCVQHIGNFSGLATGTYKAENINSSTLVVKDATGESCRSIIIFIPTGVPKLDEAVSEALAKNNGDFMMNARAYNSWWWIPYIYGRTCWTIEGDVYSTFNTPIVKRVTVVPPSIQKEEVISSPLPQEEEWSVFVNGKNDGPFKTSKIKELLSSGKIKDDTLIWKQGMAKWGKVSEMEIFKKL